MALEAGEIETRKAFEDLITRNVKAGVDHSNESRRLVRVLEEKVIKLEEQNLENIKRNEDLLLKISQLNKVLYINGIQIDD